MNVAHTYIHRLILLIVLCCMGTNNAFAANKYLVYNPAKIQCDTVEHDSGDYVYADFEFSCSIQYGENYLKFPIKGFAIVTETGTGTCARNTFQKSPKNRYKDTSTNPDDINIKWITKDCCYCKIYYPFATESFYTLRQQPHPNYNPSTGAFGYNTSCMISCRDRILDEIVSDDDGNPEIDDDGNPVITEGILTKIIKAGNEIINKI